MGHVALFALLLAPAAAQVPDTRFAPKSTIDADPECAPILAEARKAFLGTERSYRSTFSTSWIGRLEEVDSSSFPSFGEDVPRNGWSRRARQLEVPGTKPQVYVAFSRNPGCGGGCETQSALISRNQDGSDPIDAGAMPEWRFLRRDTALYLFGHNEDQITVYRLDGAEPRRACEIRLRPLAANLFAQPSAVAVRPAVDAYRESIARIRGEHGQCGTMNTHGRLGGEMSDAFEEVFYRPWALEVRDERGIADWALRGIWEYRLARESERALVLARVPLARYYATDFGWSPNEAARVADHALRAAASQGFSFSSSAAYSEDFDGVLTQRTANETNLRRALLERRPMAEIRAIQADARLVDGNAYGETILAAAVTYPQALGYLLRLGADPGKANAFGKTPLMYAAQYDQPESITLLIDHGADVNAATWVATDNCQYTVSTSGVTALHYAARYARAETIRTLLKHGAITFSPAKSSRAGEYALQWLGHYSPTPGEPNADMTEADRAALARELAVPDTATRQFLAQGFADRANRAYKARNFEGAYRLMRDSQRAAPPSTEALLDFSLIALRAVHIKDSLVAADGALAMSLTTEQRAAAWFNTGLACSKKALTPLEDTYPYCKEPPLMTFLKSWQTAPSKAREKQVAQLLDEMTPGCVVEIAGMPPEQYYRLDQRIVVRHGRESPPPPDVIEFNVKSSGKAESRRTHLSQRYEMQGFAVSVLQGDRYIQGAIRIREQTCDLN